MKLKRSELRQIIREELAEVTLAHDRRLHGPGPSQRQSEQSGLTAIASAIEDIIDNHVGDVDLDFSDKPMTRHDILDFIVRHLHEQR